MVRSYDPTYEDLTKNWAGLSISIWHRASPLQANRVVHARSCPLHSTRPVSAIGLDTCVSPTYLHGGRHTLARDQSPVQHGLGSLSLTGVIFGHVYRHVCRNWRQAQDFIAVGNGPHLCGD